MFLPPPRPQSTAFSGPISSYTTGISNPYPAPLFTHLPVILHPNEQLGIFVKRFMILLRFLGTCRTMRSSILMATANHSVHYLLPALTPSFHRQLSDPMNLYKHGNHEQTS